VHLPILAASEGTSFDAVSVFGTYDRVQGISRQGALSPHPFLNNCAQPAQATGYSSMHGAAAMLGINNNSAIIYDVIVISSLATTSNDQ
jgi:hypothetical protein